MSQTRLAPFALLVAITACQKAEPVPRASEPAMASSAVNPDAAVVVYLCADGQRIQAGYPSPDTAVITVKGRPYTLDRAVSADGVRYVGYGLQWWTKGMNKAALSVLKPGEVVA